MATGSFSMGKFKLSMLKKKEIHCWLLGHFRGGYEFDAHDTNVSIYAMAADVILDDLVVQ